MTTMRHVLVQPVGSSAEPLEIQVPGPDATVGDLKAAISSQTSSAISSQRLVARGRVLHDEDLLEKVAPTSAEGVGTRIFLALKPSCEGAMALHQCTGGSTSSSTAVPDDADEIELSLRTVDSDQSECLKIKVRLSAPAVEFKLEALIQLQLGGKSGDVSRFNFVTAGRLMRSDVTLAEVGVRSGDLVIVVPPKASAMVRVWRKLCYAVAGLRKLLYGILFLIVILLRTLWRLPGAMWHLLLNTWQDPWSLVRPERSPDEGRFGRGRRIQTLDWTPQMLRYAPGQNPNGEDFTALFTQGLLGGGF
eukprot:TRINITY_DN118451_c0_g1_i1.p1 TRINITY_DN118451_c0_g1~~TRINITY_DN118451_c0_g1_i1.p1  ORF type:complete len:313 (+),score=62.45 TRINITY_DN118451_c0_g1_i1:26-940(+)